MRVQSYEYGLEKDVVMLPNVFVNEKKGTHPQREQRQGIAAAIGGHQRRDEDGDLRAVDNCAARQREVGEGCQLG